MKLLLQFDNRAFLAYEICWFCAIHRTNSENWSDFKIWDLAGHTSFIQALPGSNKYGIWNGTTIFEKQCCFTVEWKQYNEEKDVFGPCIHCLSHCNCSLKIERLRKFRAFFLIFIKNYTIGRLRQFKYPQHLILGWKVGNIPSVVPINPFYFAQQTPRSPCPSAQPCKMKYCPMHYNWGLGRTAKMQTLILVFTSHTFIVVVFITS